MFDSAKKNIFQRQQVITLQNSQKPIQYET